MNILENLETESFFATQPIIIKSKLLSISVSKFRAVPYPYVDHRNLVNFKHF